jgi:hypothetical protein
VRLCPREQGAGQDLARGATAGVQNAPPCMAGLQTQVISKRNARVAQVAQCRRGGAGEDLNGARVVQPGAHIERVHGVQRRGIIIADRGRYTTLRARAGPRQQRPRRQHSDARAEVGRTQRGRQPGGTRTHDHDIERRLSHAHEASGKAARLWRKRAAESQRSSRVRVPPTGPTKRYSSPGRPTFPATAR